jgi:hypothetical protein
VREAHRLVPAGRLRHAQGQELEAGFPAIGESIGDDQPIRVLGPDCIAEQRDDLRIGRPVSGPRLVEEVEAEAAVRDAAVPGRDERPVPRARPLGRGVGEKVARLGRWIHAVAGCPVEVQADVDPVANPPPHGLIDRGERVLVDPLPVATDGPEPVVEREPHEVEAELRDEPEVLLLERPLGPFRGHHVGQIESAPPRQMRGGGIRQGRGRERGGFLCGQQPHCPARNDDDERRARVPADPAPHASMVERCAIARKSLGLEAPGWSISPPRRPEAAAFSALVSGARGHYFACRGPYEGLVPVYRQLLGAGQRAEDGGGGPRQLVHELARACGGGSCCSCC